MIEPRAAENLRDLHWWAQRYDLTLTLQAGSRPRSFRVTVTAPDGRTLHDEQRPSMAWSLWLAHQRLYRTQPGPAAIRPPAHRQVRYRARRGPLRRLLHHR